MPVAAASYPYPGAPSAPTPQGTPLRPPDDYLRLEGADRPEAFGAQVGAAEERAGAQIGQGASELFGAVMRRQEQHNAIVADDYLTKFNNDADNLLYTGPDALFKKRGEDYMKAHDSTLAALQQLRGQYQAQLNPAQQLLFNNESRGYLIRETRVMGARFDEAQKEYGLNTNAAGTDLDARRIAADPENQTVFDQSRESMRNRAIKNLELLGRAGDPDARADALAKADSAAWHARIEALLLTNPGAAEAAMKSAPPGTFTGDDLYRYQFRLDAAANRAERAATKTAISDATAAIMGGGVAPGRAPHGGRPGQIVPGPSPVSPAQVTSEAQSQGVDPKLANTTAAIESDHGANVGKGAHAAYRGNVFQLGPEERVLSGGSRESMGSADAQVRQGVQFLKLTRANLADRLDREPTNAEIYLAHQQGAIGAAQLIQNPDKRAGDLVGDQAIRNNGGDPNQPASTFVNMWRQKYAAAEQRFGRRGALTAGAAAAPQAPAVAGGPPLDPSTVKTLREGGMSDAEIERVRQATNAPGQAAAAPDQVVGTAPPAAPVTTAAATGRPAAAEPIPVSPQPQAPIDKLRPDFEGMEERAYAIENDDVRRGVLANLQRAKSQWSLATATDRRQTLLDVNNTIRQRMIGQDVPDIDEKRIRHLFPQEQADDMLEKLGDAKIYGDTLNRVNTQTLPEIVNERARFAAARGVPGIHDVGVRAQGAADYDKASQAVIKGMQTDPAAQMASRPELRDLGAALSQLQPPATDADLPAYQQAHEHYANSMLAAQQSWGLPAAHSHVLTLTQAQQLAEKLTTDPAGAPELMAGMEREWGSAWPSVWHDVVSLGQLPAEFQAVGILDSHNAMRLAQGLRDEQGGEGEKEKGTAVWEKLLGPQVVSGASGVIPSVRADPRVSQFLLSMNSGGATGPEMDSVLHAIDTLAFSLMAHEPSMAGAPGQSKAVETAITAVTGLYEYLPNGGARVPKAQYDNVTQAAATTIAGLSPDRVQIPRGFSGTHGEPTTADYIAALKGNPLWINGHEGIDLIDNGGRRVNGTDGKPLHIPFDVPPTPGAGIGRPDYAVPIPPM